MKRLTSLWSSSSVTSLCPPRWMTIATGSCCQNQNTCWSSTCSEAFKTKYSSQRKKLWHHKSLWPSLKAKIVSVRWNSLTAQAMKSSRSRMIPKANSPQSSHFILLMKLGEYTTSKNQQTDSKLGKRSSNTILKSSFVSGSTFTLIVDL